MTAARWRRRPRRAGFESLWTGEHVVLPDPQVAALADAARRRRSSIRPSRWPSLAAATTPRPARHRHHHPAAAQSAGARQGARERRRRVGRAPDLRSRHRLPEAGVRRARHSVRAQGRARDRVPRGDPARCGRRRSRRTTGASSPSRGIQALPRPVQQPHPPIVIGGHTPAAYRRAVSHANGWYGFALDLADDAPNVSPGCAARSPSTSRPAALGALEISITPRGPLDRDTVGASPTSACTA